VQRDELSSSQRALNEVGILYEMVKSCQTIVSCGVLCEEVAVGPVSREDSADLVDTNRAGPVIVELHAGFDDGFALLRADIEDQQMPPSSLERVVSPFSRLNSGPSDT
jgi:hypothetical protein